jgi:NodT family efflux transporter outer membrane factor (OMF) lipoprotein
MNSWQRARLARWLPAVGLSVLIVLGGSACAVRRPYTEPVAAVPPTWTQPAPETAAPASLAAWWDAFQDPLLTSLVTRAVQGNLDVRVAVSRLREARASARGARGPLGPVVDASASGRLAGQGGSAFEGTTQSYGLSLDASWELDVFGGIQSAVDAATATAGARIADLQDVLISLAAEAAIDYIEVRSLQRRLEIARTNVALQEETLELTRLRLQAGLGTDLEVQQALSNVESTRAQIALLESQTAQAIHALSGLIGQPPDALAGELAPAGPIPTAPITVAVGIPADAIRRRPDVRSAERQLAAQFAQVNAARADLYPSFRLAGSIGLESLSLAKLLLPGAGAWNIVPSSSTRLFNRRQLRENVNVQTERQTQAALAYESQVLTALREVEDSLISLTREQSRRDSLAAAADAAQQSAALSLQLYTAGLRDFREVLDAQRSLLTLQDSLASSEASVSADLVSLYKALGGGWQTAETLGAGL